MFRAIQAVGKDFFIFSKRAIGFFWPASAMQKIFRLGAAAAVVAGGVFLFFPQAAEEAAPVNKAPQVAVGTVRTLENSDSRTFVGTVRAVSEAQIQSEGAGRITSVRVKAGDTVRAGAIIATLENSAEYAAVLQAQGGYEAALAAAASSKVSVADAESALDAAKTSAVTTYKQAYNTVSNTIFSDIDRFYGSPRASIPGVRIDAAVSELNRRRVALEQSLTSWNSQVQTASQSNIAAQKAAATKTTEEAIAILNILITASNNSSASDRVEGVPLSSYTSSLISAKNSLQGTLQSFAAASTAIVNAEDGVRRAQIGATNPDINAADAQIKQALGSLRAAQSRLSKTIMRTPISGVVNTLHVNVGDFVSSFAPIAEVANNGSLEISIFVGENDLQSFAVGEEVIIEGERVGTVANIAPAIDPETLKTEVKVATDDTSLVNGSTVSLRLSNQKVAEESIVALRVPINAIKFVGDESFLFTVEDGMLVAQPVVFSTIQGSFVSIESGITADTKFVLDVRGLHAGQEVTVANNAEKQ